MATTKVDERYQEKLRARQQASGATEEPPGTNTGTQNDPGGPPGPEALDARYRAQLIREGAVVAMPNEEDPLAAARAKMAKRLEAVLRRARELGFAIEDVDAMRDRAMHFSDQELNEFITLAEGDLAKARAEINAPNKGLNAIVQAKADDAPTASRGGAKAKSKVESTKPEFAAPPVNEKTEKPR